MRTFGHGYDVVCFYRKSNHKGLIPLIWSRPFFQSLSLPLKKLLPDSNICDYGETKYNDL